MIKLLKSRTFWGLLVFYLFLATMMPHNGFLSDQRWWLSWMDEVRLYGVVDAYGADPYLNYLPPYIYILKGLQVMFFNTAGDIWNSSYFLKLFSLCFDFATAVLAWRILKKLKIPQERLWLIVINIAILYNTFIWGQVDNIPTFFALASLWVGLNNKTLASVFLYLLALNFKLQAIVFAPIIGLVLLPQLVKERRKILNALGVVLATEGLILAPFILSGKLHFVWRVLTGLVDTNPNISFHAYNFWVLLLGPGAVRGSDAQIIFAGLSYKTVALIMFGLALIAVLIPVGKMVWDKIKEGTDHWDLRKQAPTVFLAAGLSIFVFFYFSTQMHERYLYPGLIFIALYAVAKADWSAYLAYILVSLGFFLNVERIMEFLPVDHNSVIFSSRITALIFLAGLIILVWKLFKIRVPLRK